METGELNSERARALLQPVTPKWRAFWLHMHLMVDSLPALALALPTISEDIYLYHWRGHEYALARWVHEVIGDEELAAELRAAATLAAAVEATERRVQELTAAARESAGTVV
jgi:hypothetical protein